MNKNTKKIFLIVLIIIAIASFLYTYKYFSKINTTSIKENNIVIFVGNQEITEVNGKKIDINKDITFIIGDKDEEYNTIEIKNKKIRCIDANCPDKVCVNHKELRSDIDNDMIICAPHHMIIKYDN